jgi:hypothetical protein
MNRKEVRNPILANRQAKICGLLLIELAWVNISGYRFLVLAFTCHKQYLVVNLKFQVVY